MNLELSLDQLIRWLNTPLFSVGETDVNAMRIVGLVLILILSWWAARMIERTMVRLSSGRKTGMSDSALYALGRIMRYVIWIIGSVIGLSFIGFDLGSLAIMGGALGVGIGFGLQNIFSNLISGIIILLEKTLKVGDFVNLESGVMGRVAEINMRYTRIITNDAVDVLVPNSEFINGRVVNWTFGDSLRRIRVPFGVAYGTDKDTVRDVVLEAARSIEDTVEDATHQTEVWLVSFGESSLDFELLVWVGESGVRAPGRMLAKYLWAVEAALSGAQIEIPFPQRDLHVRSGRLEVAMPEPADQGRPA